MYYSVDNIIGRHRCQANSLWKQPTNLPHPLLPSRITGLLNTPMRLPAPLVTPCSPIALYWAYLTLFTKPTDTHRFALTAFGIEDKDEEKVHAHEVPCNNNIYTRLISGLAKVHVYVWAWRPGCTWTLIEPDAGSISTCTYVLILLIS